MVTITATTTIAIMFQHYFPLSFSFVALTFTFS
jgi:hypothetical protein